MVHAAIVADLSVCDQTGSRPALPTMMPRKGRSGRPYLKFRTRHDITPAPQVRSVVMDLKWFKFQYDSDAC